MKNLRKINSLLALILVILILLHGIMGSFELLGIGTNAGTLWSWTAIGIGFVHGLIGIILTIRTFRAQKRSGGSLYLKQNAAFWIRRLSGMAIIILTVFHIGMFGKTIDGVYTLLPFTTLKLIMTMLLIASVFIHIFANVRPLLVSLGIIEFKERKADLLLILAFFLLFISVSVILYYISWCI